MIVEANCARQELTDFLRRARSLPSWQPQCPFAASDDELGRRLDTAVDSLEAARNHLQVKKGALLLAAKWKSPLKCDQPIEQEIHFLTRLCELAAPASLQLFVQYYRKVPRNLFATLEPSVKASLTRLSAVSADLKTEAQRYVCKIAHPGTPFWRAEYDNFIAQYDADLRAVVACFEKRIADAAEARRQLEVRHDETLQREFETKLLPAVAAVTDSVEFARSTVAEARRASEREAESIDTIRAVWQGLQGKKQKLFRHPKCLGEVDLALVAHWGAGRPDEGYRLKALGSARGAELVALEIYRELYGDAEDISIKQVLQPADRGWRLADIKARAELIDVKNAMQSFSSRRRYSEHHVKRFKQDDNRRDVVISGFLSPYPQEGHADQGTDEDQSVCWLGETSLGTIEQMRREFEAEYLELDLPTTRTTLVPPWLFDYPGPIYAERDAALALVGAADFAFPRANCPVGAVVLAGRVPTPPANDQLAEEAHALCQRRYKLGFMSRPVLYLHILDRFCRSVVGGTRFPADILRKIILPSVSSVLHGVPDSSTPLAVLDPVEIVCELIDVLESVSTYCSLGEYGFNRFKLTGKSLFRGCRRNGAWRTILAYCGGWKMLNGARTVKCGRNPLFIGQNEVCTDPACGNLICDCCGFCRKKCPSCSGRQERWMEP